ncbi:hypothetical protein GCM10022224_102690 [Nonomuraea antimicrobica]|uniref:Uncharacterized protein n=1 Tax=Nonomuraea antimicrobica TaxID=561173 RepID=A0ABP7EQ96_9ACTN
MASRLCDVRDDSPGYEAEREPRAGSAAKYVPDGAGGGQAGGGQADALDLVAAARPAPPLLTHAVHP